MRTVKSQRSTGFLAAIAHHVTSLQTTQRYLGDYSYEANQEHAEKCLQTEIQVSQKESYQRAWLINLAKDETRETHQRHPGR